MSAISIKDYPWGEWKWRFDCDLVTARTLCRRASRRYGKRFAAEKDEEGKVWGFTLLQPAKYDWSKERVVTVGNRKQLEKLAREHGRRLVKKGREWHLLRQEEFEDIVDYDWNIEVGKNFRLSLACEKWRAKAMVKRHSKGGKKFVIYYGNHPVRHMRVMRVA